MKLAARPFQLHRICLPASFSWHQIMDQFQMFFSDTCADPWLDSSKDEALQGGKVTVAL